MRERERRCRRKSSFQMKVPKEKKEKLIAFDEAIITECFRQMTANEAAWILLCFPIAKQSHTVRLIVQKPEIIIEAYSGQATNCTLGRRAVCDVPERRRGRDLGESGRREEEVGIRSFPRAESAVG